MVNGDIVQFTNFVADPQTYSPRNESDIGIINLSNTEGGWHGNIGQWQSYDFRTTHIKKGILEIQNNQSVSYELVPTQASITVKSINDAPELTGSIATLNNGIEDRHIIKASELLTGFSDIDGDTLSITNLETSNGQLINNNDGNWILKTSQDFNGDVSKLCSL